jgi:two-component system, NarL family, response regulator DevR
MNKLRLLLVDDHQVVRVGLRALLDSEPDIEVVAEAATAAQAIEQAGEWQPDVVIMDVRLPDRSGLAACKDIRQSWPRIQVLVLTSYADEELVMEAIDAGAAGYVLKQLDTSELVKIVQAVARGDAVLDPVVTRKLLQRVQRAEHESHEAAFRDLSSRELDVLALVAEGKTNAEIATQLNISEKTAGNHVGAILSKLNVTNRIEAATYAVRNHIERIRPS